MSFSLEDCPTLSDYITRYQVDGILWKAERLLKDIDNAVMRNDRVADIARTIALMPAAHQVVKDDYILKISKTYNITRKTLEKLVVDQTEIEEKKSAIVRGVRKNSVVKLDGNPKTFPFFTELFTAKTKELKGIKIDMLKFVQLLGSFGFTRYANEGDSPDDFTFVRLIDNVISEVRKQEIIDFIENFIQKEYDFAGAGCRDVDADYVINVFYENIKKYFSTDLFARVRNPAPIIINRDTESECFLYFKNGFVRITKDGHELIQYEKMNGSVWTKQMLNRSFETVDLPVVAKEDGTPDWENSFTTERNLGDFADFVWRITGQKQQRFISFCTIIGYLMHDYYEYKLKCIFLTDSTISEKSEGRTGKTLAMQMLGHSRSYCEINGKQFNPEDERKYQLADRSTQILHINDVSHKGRYRFVFENLFNDITEGYYVRKMFKDSYRQRSKVVVSSNKSINIEGPSERDRILEFEMSNFFSEHRSPLQYYGKWMGKGWEEADWKKYDNFLCFCARAFLAHGLITPDTINLEARKLLDHTAPEFLEFMGDVADYITTKGLPWDGYKDESPDAGDLYTKKETLTDWKLDKRKLYERFQTTYPDYKSNHFTNKRFHGWLIKYAALKLGIKEPIETRSNGNSFIQFKEKGT